MFSLILVCALVSAPAPDASLEKYAPAATDEWKLRDWYYDIKMLIWVVGPIEWGLDYEEYADEEHGSSLSMYKPNHYECAAMKRFAIGQRLVYPNEPWYGNFRDDVRFCRNTYAQLYQAPDIADLQFLPNRKTVEEALDFNTAYQRRLEAAIKLGRTYARRLEPILAETMELSNIWHQLRVAHMNSGTLSTQRWALYNYKIRVGEDNYYRGIVPDVVPTRFFESRDK